MKMESFKITNKEEWLQTLNISEKELLRVIEHKSLFYKQYNKAKANGYRTIYCIDKNSALYALQSRIQKCFFCNIFLPECVYGFREKRSYIDFLTFHVSPEGKFYLRLDIKDFFESISVKYIKSFFKYYIDDKMDDEEKAFIIDSIINITTLNNKFIQGAVTSPSISNFAFRKIDIRISRYCKELNVCYTRYADDMLFSSTNKYMHSKHFIIAIQSIVNEFGFALNYAKTLKYKNEISLNGYVIGTDIRLSRKKFHKINELIFQLNNSNFHGLKNNIEKYHVKNQLAGHRSLLIQLKRCVNDSDYRKRLQSKISIIEGIMIKQFT